MAQSGTLFKAVDLPSKTINFANVKSMIAAHFGYLMHHHKFLTRIENGSISKDEEIDEYLDEVIGASYKRSIYTRKECIQAIHEQILKKIEMFKVVYLLTFEEPSDVNLLTLIYLIDFLIKSDCFYQKLMKRGCASVESLIEAAFDNIDQIRSLRRALKHCMPASYAQIEKMITVDLQATVEPKLTHSALDQITTKTTVKYEWHKLMAIYTNVLAEKTSSAEDSVEKFVMLTELEELKLIFTGKNKAQSEPEPKTLADQYRYQSQVLKERITAALNALALLEKYKSQINKAKIAREQAQKAELAKKVIWPKIKIEIEKLERQLQATRDNVGKSHSPDEVEHRLAFAIDQIKLINGIAAAKQNARFETVEEVEKINAEFQEEKKSLYAFMEKVSKEAQEAKGKAVSPETKAETVAKPEQFVPVETAEAFKLRKAEETKQWKERSEKARQEKSADKQAQKHDSPASAPPSPKQEQHEKVVDPVIVNILLSLKPKKLELLRRVLNHSTTLKYQQIFLLITKRLGGEITSTASSGSHRRVRIGATYTEFLARNLQDPDPTQEDSDSSDEAAETPSSPPTPSSSPTLFATTGASRPHKRGHNSGHNSKTLSRSNVELIAKGLSDAGITLKLLDKIEELKAAPSPTMPSAKSE